MPSKRAALARLIGYRDGDDIPEQINGRLSSSNPKYAVSKKSSSQHNIPLTTFSEMSLREARSLFEAVYTQAGWTSLETWFKEHAVIRDGALPTTTYSRSSAPPPGSFLDENAFLELIRRISDFPDYEIVTLFDLLDHGDNGEIQYSEFILTVCMVAALESHQLTEYVYFHHAHLFELLKDHIQGGVHLGSVIALVHFWKIPEDHVLCCANEFAISESLDASNFEMLLFALVSVDVVPNGWLNSVVVPSVAAGGSGGCCVML